MTKQYYIYIMTNYSQSSLYIGITNDLKRRVYEHKCKLIKGYTARYNIDKLVYYEIADNPESAIVREKQLKAGSRQKKTDLINSRNPNWNDLYNKL